MSFAIYWDQLKDRLQPANLKWELGYVEIGFLCALYLCFIVLFPSEPMDDLKRHLIAHQYNFEYQNLYLYTTFPDYYNLYPAFDAFAGFLHQHIGYYSFIVIQVLLTALTMVGMLALMRRANTHLAFLVLMVLLYYMSVRLSMGRPASFASALMLIGMGFADKKNPWLHITNGLLIALTYHLFWVYLLPLILLRRLYIVPMLIGFGGWMLYSDGAYLHTVWELATASQHQLIEISERATILRSLGVAIVFIPVLYYFHRDWKRVLTMTYFAAPNQIRYFENIMPLALSFGRFAKWKPDWRILLCVFAMACLTKGAPGQDPTLLKRDYFENARILTTDIADMYVVIYQNDQIKVAPTFHLGWTDQKLQLLLKDIGTTGKLDCNKLAQFDFDYVIDKRLKDSPTCLTYVESAREYGIWRVKKNDHKTQQ